MERFALWVGVLLMGIGLFDSLYAPRPTILGVAFPIGATVVFFAINRIENRRW